MTPQILYNLPRQQYDAIDAVNISVLLHMEKSPKHYRHAAFNRFMPRSKPLSLGIAAHVATLEPLRFAEYAVWRDRKSNGDMSPRKGPKWEEFQIRHQGQEIITETEWKSSLEIAFAVGASSDCTSVLQSGFPELTLLWTHEETDIACKARLDWAQSSLDSFLDLKTAADITPHAFFAKAARYRYHVRMAWYGDALRICAGKSEQPETLLIAVESDAPYDSGVLEYGKEELDLGRETYEALLRRLAVCRDANSFPGQYQGRARMEIPKYEWLRAETETDFEADLGLDFGKER
jgi:hypothetical protein